MLVSLMLGSGWRKKILPHLVPHDQPQHCAGWRALAQVLPECFHGFSSFAFSRTHTFLRAEAFAFHQRNVQRQPDDRNEQSFCVRRSVF
jgi:hypothetical protein